MEKELLQQALNSILHGSSQIISKDDGYGNITNQEIRVGDLRVQLVNKIAEKLVTTPAYQEAILKAFTPEVIKKLQEKVMSSYNYNDLPYQTKDRISNEMKNIEVSVKRFKLVAETVDENNQ